jgi:hypothetical protein
LGQAQINSGVKLVNEIPTLPFVIIWSATTTTIQIQTNNKNLHILAFTFFFNIFRQCTYIIYVHVIHFTIFYTYQPLNFKCHFISFLHISTNWWPIYLGLSWRPIISLDYVYELLILNLLAVSVIMNYRWAFVSWFARKANNCYFKQQCTYCVYHVKYKNVQNSW